VRRIFEMSASGFSRKIIVSMRVTAIMAAKALNRRKVPSPSPRVGVCFANTSFHTYLQAYVQGCWPAFASAEKNITVSSPAA
jgi:hypothetical protein